MGVQKLARLVCDRCGVPAELFGDTIKEAYYAGLACGFSTYNKEVFCPKCWEKRKGWLPRRSTRSYSLHKSGKEI